MEHYSRNGQLTSSTLSGNGGEKGGLSLCPDAVGKIKEFDKQFY